MAANAPQRDTDPRERGAQQHAERHAGRDGRPRRVRRLGACRESLRDDEGAREYRGIERGKSGVGHGQAQGNGGGQRGQRAVQVEGSGCDQD